MNRRLAALLAVLLTPALMGASLAPHDDEPSAPAPPVVQIVATQPGVSPTISVPADAEWSFSPSTVTARSPEQMRVERLQDAGLIASPDGEYVAPLAEGVGRFTSSFGYRTDPWPGLHNGSDWAAPSGTPLYAIADAEVVHVSTNGWSERGLSGTVVGLRLDDGTVVTYGHMSAASVSVGQRVEAGDQIGAVGSTGNSTGPHLHLYIAPGSGDPTDPVTWLSEHGISF